MNSLRRLTYAAAIGCHSADGTYLAYGPDRNLPTLLRWLRIANTETDGDAVDKTRLDPSANPIIGFRASVFPTGARGPGNPR